MDRPHPFAAERVGFLACRAGRLDGGGIVILAADYDPVADEDYVDDLRVGAMMGPAAIRKALQRAYNDGRGDLSLFHVHMHEHSGLPGFQPRRRRGEPAIRAGLFQCRPGHAARRDRAEPRPRDRAMLADEEK